MERLERIKWLMSELTVELWDLQTELSALALRGHLRLIPRSDALEIADQCAPTIDGESSEEPE